MAMGPCSVKRTNSMMKSECVCLCSALAFCPLALVNVLIPSIVFVQSGELGEVICLKVFMRSETLQ